MDARIENVAIVGVGVGTIIPNDGSWPRESRGAHRRWATAVYLHEAKEPVRHNRAETRPLFGECEEYDHQKPNRTPSRHDNACGQRMNDQVVLCEGQILTGPQFQRTDAGGNRTPERARRLETSGWSECGQSDSAESH